MKTILKLLLFLLLPLSVYSQTVSNDIVEINIPAERNGSDEQDYFNFVIENGHSYNYLTEQGNPIHIHIYENNVLISKHNGIVSYSFDRYLESKRYYTGQHTTENGEKIPYEFTIDFVFVKDQFIRVYLGDVPIFLVENLKPIK